MGELGGREWGGRDRRGVGSEVWGVGNAVWGMGTEGVGGESEVVGREVGSDLEEARGVAVQPSGVFFPPREVS